MPRARRVRGKGVRRRGRGVWSGVKRRGKNFARAASAMVAARTAPLRRLSGKRGTGVWSKVKRVAKYALPAAALGHFVHKAYKFNRALNNIKDAPVPFFV